MKVLFLLHMHQPPYRILRNGAPYYSMPWVFTHLIREYYDVAATLKNLNTPLITINFSGSLIEQIKDYEEGRAQDEFLIHYEKDPKDMDENEKIFLLRNFFSVNYDLRIKPYKKYLELFVKRGTPSNLQSKIERFTDQELRDLQVYFLLSQVSIIEAQKDSLLKDLIQKERGYTEEDKKLLFQKCFEIARNVLKTYRELATKGTEISFTPMYHPILPLIISNRVAKESNSSCQLPDLQFSSPSDAEIQVKMGKNTVESVFGEVKGSWPAEGAVSSTAIEIFKKLNVKWIATDEYILNKSIGKFRENEEFGGEHLYKVYNHKGVNIFFRDHTLSDLIGFVYSRWNISSAVDDFMRRLESIKKRKPDAVVSVILDGENPWEYYPDGGTEFLPKLLEKISENYELTTFSTLESEEELKNLHPGSWINADFSTWICDQEKNLGWTYLERVRRQIYDKLKSNESAYNEWLMAEASDWFWWLGEGHSSMYDKEFDRIFREHLKSAYNLLGMSPPEFLDIPIKTRPEFAEILPPRIYKTPKIDGKISNYFEWRLAGRIKPHHTTMARSEEMLSEIFYMFDKSNLYLLLDFGENRADDILSFGTSLKLEVREDDHGVNFEISKPTGEENGIKWAAHGKLEIKIPRELTGDSESLALKIEILKNNNVLFSYPDEGYYILKKTDYDPDAIYW